jgi:hypothetical protein
MTPDFYEKLLLTLVDKGALALLVVIVGFWINKRLEKFKSEQFRISELAKQKQSLENELRRQRDTIKLQFIERQLSQFYWPIYLRLQKDNEVWNRVHHLSDRSNVLPKELGTAIEKNFLLPNHDEMVKIIESGIHLAKDDEELFKVLIKYIKHAALYKSIRSAGRYDLNPIDVGEPFPKNLFTAIEKKTMRLQKQYDELLDLHQDAAMPNNDMQRTRN